MVEPTNRVVVQAYYAAVAARQIERVASFLDDDIDWLIQGPVTVFHFLGQRHGKAEVLASFQDIARVAQVTGYDIETLLVDGDQAAALIKITSIQRSTGRITSFKASQFSTFRSGKMARMRSVIDSYDVVEQAIGRSLGVCRSDIGTVGVA